MIFRQLFDSVSGTYSYLLASRAGGEALILDPVLEKVDRYCQLLRELDLRLVKAVDTHLHADHVTGLGELRDRTHCVTIMGEQSKADVVAMRVAEGDRVTTRKTIRGTHAGPLPDIAPTGMVVAIEVIDIVRLRDGRYIEHWGINTLPAVLAQLRASAGGRK